MSTEAQQIANQIAGETQEYGNKKERVAGGFRALDRDKAEIDASNLDPQNVQNWKDKLEITVFTESDTLGTVVDRGAVTSKNITIGGLKATSLNNAQGDPLFTKSIVAKPDGTIGWENKAPTTPRNSLVEFAYGSENITNTIADIIHLYNNDSGVRTITHTNFNTNSNNGKYIVVVRSGTNFKITPGNAGYSGIVLYKDGTISFFGGSYPDSSHTLRSGRSYIFTEKPGYTFYYIFEI